QTLGGPVACVPWHDGCWCTTTRCACQSRSAGSWTPVSSRSWWPRPWRSATGLMYRLTRAGAFALAQHERIAVDWIIQRAQVIAAIRQIGDHVDTIAHELTELLGAPSAFAALDAAAPDDREARHGAPMLTSIAGGAP